jgi:hypothetical protein
MKLAVLLLLGSSTVVFAQSNSAVERALKTVPPGATDLVPRVDGTKDETVVEILDTTAKFNAFQATPGKAEFNETLADTASVAAPPRNMPWETATSGLVSLAVPKGWRSFDGIRPTMVIYRQGDGIGVPMADETGGPLQIGITAERFPASEEPLDAIAAETAKGAENDPRLKRAKKDLSETVTLSDQTSAIFTAGEFIKSSTRRSLQMKLFTKAPDGSVWVVSGYIVGGKDSTWPTHDSPLATWLRAHLVSLTLTGKEIDARALESTYEKLAVSAK